MELDRRRNQTASLTYWEFLSKNELMAFSGGSLTLVCEVEVRRSLQARSCNTPKCEIPNFTLPSKLNEFRQKEHYCDITLVANGKEFKAHKAILATQSAFFDACFKECWEHSDRRLKCATWNPKLLKQC